ncbi:hypothetical protein L0Y65_02925 [Candidatus Micrarchaeota archaeon]|nr:hypothetical protein [Candidatus Micrarchaeota archaeon]
MAGVFETIYDAVVDAVGFFLKRPGETVAEFAKVAAIGLGAQLMFLFLIMAAGLAIGGSASLDVLTIAFVIAIALIAIAFFIVSTAVSATPYCIVSGMRKNRKTGIIQKARELLPAVAGYCGAIIALLIIVFSLALGGALLSGGNEMVAGFLMLGALAAVIVAVFFIQFAVPDMAVNGTDALGSLKSSYTTVTKNVWAVLLFDIILVIALFGTVMVFSVPQGIIENQLAATTDNLAAAIVLFGLSLAASLLETIAVSLIAVNLTYSFWRALIGPEAPPPEAAVPKKRAARR